MAYIAAALTAFKAYKDITAPKQKAQAVPTPPTIDEAAQNSDSYDRVRRRKGVLANLYGGVASGSETQPTVATKTALGQ